MDDQAKYVHAGTVTNGGIACGWTLYAGAQVDQGREDDWTESAMVWMASAPFGGAIHLARGLRSMSMGRLVFYYNRDHIRDMRTM